VLDRSIELIAAASADARTFDRQLIAQVSDVWDNNTYPFFGAAVARDARREVLADQGFGWMASSGSDRREWVLEQATACGHSISLPPASYQVGANYRDYRGVVRPAQVPLRSEVAAEIGADYDLTTARVRHLRVERSGGGLGGRLLLAMDRRFTIDRDDGPSAELDLRFEGIDDVRFELDDSVGVAIAGLDGSDGITAGGDITIGAEGVLRASRATAWIQDSWWHLSAAGRAADARTSTGSRPREDLPERGSLGGAAQLAAWVLRFAMLEIRMVRYASMADQIPVHRIARVFGGAGSDVVTLGARRWGRDAAFRRLIERWISTGGDDLAPFFRRTLHYFADGRESPSSLRQLARDLSPSASDEVSDRSALPPGSEVVLVEYSAASEHHQSSVLVQAAVPENAGWTLRGAETEQPGRVGVVLRAGRLAVSGF
jgi:hypothetical protein